MEREDVVAYLASLTDEERDAVLAESVQRAHPWHRRNWNGNVVCVRLAGDRYLIAITDDPAKAESEYAENKLHGADWFVEENMQKVD